MIGSHSTRRLLSIAALVAACFTSTTAHANDEDFYPLGALGQVGLGMVTRVGDSDAAMTEKREFDGTLRIGKVWRAIDQVRPGGFLEFRTTGSFDTLEAAIGPQVQIRIGQDFALQARGGIGAVADGGNYALAGLQLGHLLAGVTVTGRRYFDDDSFDVSVNLELTTAILLLPFVRF